MEKQKTSGLFDFSIVIVDNDRAESAKRNVAEFSRQSELSISYFVEPEQNIALARNRAIANSRGDFVGFIDDDEVPIEDWLLEHYRAIHYYEADGVLGPVLPEYEKPPPKWVVKGRFFDRPSLETGCVLTWKDTRTGNALLKRDLFRAPNQCFDSRHGSGGEDKNFFLRKISDGKVFVWCREAAVYETVPEVRWRRKFMVKKALLRGKVVFQTASNKPFETLKSLTAITIYTLSLPFLLILGHHFFMSYLVKSCDHIGKVLTALGVDIVREKYVME